jgi:hypothetical protein
MVRLPYGFGSKMPNAADEPWTKLMTIAEYLQDCEVIPPDLAAWLGEAIVHSGRDSRELLRRLGLARKRGKPASDTNAWLKYGERIFQLENDGMKPEAAIAKVASESDDGQREKYSRQQLQKFRDIYRKARANNER